MSLRKMLSRITVVACALLMASSLSFTQTLGAASPKKSTPTKTAAEPASRMLGPARPWKTCRSAPTAH
jgi:hypothetical protein